MKLTYLRIGLSIAAITLMAACMSIPASSSHLIQVDVNGIQPATPVAPATGLSRSRAVGDTNFTNLVTSGNLTVGGAANITGALTANGVITNSGNLTMVAITATTAALGNASLAGNLKVAGPTAAASATPVAYVNNLGAANDIMVLAKNGTPVWKLSNSGAVTGYVLRYASSGKSEVCGTTTITGTGTLATGLSTPSAVVALNMGADANYDHNRLSFTNSAATVTAKVWNGAATPAAAATPVSIDWCVIGTP